MEMKRERNRWFLFGGIVVMFSILYGSMLFINKSTDNLISSRENRIEEVVSETESLKKAGINLSKKDIQSLFTIESERILWAKKLQLLSKTTPSDMAITGLTYRNNRFIISAISRISGEEKEFSVVENFIKKLNSIEDFSNDFKTIKFLSSERLVVRNQEILMFKIEAQLDRGGKRG